MMTTHFIAHDVIDTVGVVVVEKIITGQKVSGWIMESDQTITVEALEDVPLGHKIALTEIKNKDTIEKKMNSTQIEKAMTFSKDWMARIKKKKVGIRAHK